MATDKYKKYGIRRDNNLSDLADPVQGLNNILNNLPGVGGDITFISSDLDAVRNLSSTNLSPKKIIGLAGTAVVTTVITETEYQLATDVVAGSTVIPLTSVSRLVINQNIISDSVIPPNTFIVAISVANNIIEISNGTLINQLAGDKLHVNVQTLDVNDPLVRLEDRIAKTRLIAKAGGPFPSGVGPSAYFVPSTKLVTGVTAPLSIDDRIISADYRNDSGIRRDDDFWTLGEFVFENALDYSMPNKFGGVVWDGFFLPNPRIYPNVITYNTNGLFQFEFRKTNSDPWEIAKSIYAVDRAIEVAMSTTANEISLVAGSSKYVSVGDIVAGDPENLVESINGDIITVTLDTPATVGEFITLSLSFGKDPTSGTITLDTVLEPGEGLNIRIFWWFPTGFGPVEYKYMSMGYIGGRYLPFAYLTPSQPTNTVTDFEIINLLNNAVTPYQPNFGIEGDYQDFRIASTIKSTYVPRANFISASSADKNLQIHKASLIIEVKDDEKSATRISGTSLSDTDAGNIIIPEDPTLFDNVIPKGFVIKGTIGSNTSSNTRLTTVPAVIDSPSVPVHVIDHLGMIDYGLGTTSGNATVISIADTSLMSVGYVFITTLSESNIYNRITEIINNTSIRVQTSVDMGTVGEYFFVYADRGIIDKSKQIFCEGVFGTTLSANAAAGQNTIAVLEMQNIVIGQSVQFGASLPANTRVSAVSTSAGAGTITINTNVSTTIQQDETLTIAPWLPVGGTMPNKELCVLPLDLSPPFVGVPQGLSTNGKNITSTFPTEFNVKLTDLTMNNVSGIIGINAVDLPSRSYNKTISLKNAGFVIPTKLI